MLENFILLIDTLFCSVILLFVISKLYGVKIQYTKTPFISGLLFETGAIFLTMTVLFPNFTFIRYSLFLLNLLYLCISNVLVFRKDIRKTLISSIIAYTLLILSELLIVMVLYLINEDLLLILSNFSGSVVGIGILILCIKINWYKFLYVKLLEYTKKISLIKFVLFPNL